MIPGFTKPWKPVFTHLLYQNASKHTRKYGNILETYYFCKYYGHKTFETFRNVLEALSTAFLSLFISFIWKWVSRFYIISCGDEDQKMIHFNKKHFQKLGYEFHIHQKNMKWKCCIFYFQVRESPKSFIFKAGNHPILISR